MNIRFTKMHGLGNDFIIIDAIRQTVALTSQDIVSLSHRHTGIGFDQCLFIETSPKPNVDFFYRIFNANGQEVGQCGNGARCLARFAYEQGLTNKTVITVETHTTRMQLCIHPDNTVTIDMGIPLLQPSRIPLSVNEQARVYQIPITKNSTQPIHAISVGNPHAIVVVSDISKAPVASMGALISQHDWFPQQTNVGFMHITSPNCIQLRVYERGCGETEACGSAAVAAVAIGRLYHKLASHVQVYLPGGVLTVDWPHQTQSIFLSGPAQFVYHGELITDNHAEVSGKP